MDRTIPRGGAEAAPQPPPYRPVESGESVVHLATVLRVLMYSGLAIILLGTALALVRHGNLPTPVTNVTALPGQLAGLHSDAILSLGILIFLCSPAAALAYLTVSYLLARNRLYTVIAAVVLAIVLGSIVVARYSGAGAGVESGPELTLAREAAIFLLSLSGGILGSMVGIGGGIFMVPVLTAFVGIPIKTAIAASAVSVIVNSIGGSSVYLQHKLTNVRLALFMELTTAVGAIAGGLLVVYIAGNPLRVIFALALVGMGLAMLRQQKQQAPATSGDDPLRLAQVFHDPVDQADVVYIPQRLPLGAVAGFLAGVISGLLGIGGGAIKIPIMNALMRVPVKAAAATSILMVGITVSASAFIYYIHDLIDLSVTIPAVLGILIGSQTGAAVSRHLKSVTLVRVLVLIVVYLAINLLLQALGIRLPGTSGS
ncbi:MAG TPA: TSUP family transporter [Nitrolancea sp.]|nr:TSUP family transporter [Nitrolancea sp.]